MNHNKSNPFNSIILTDISDEESGELIQLIATEEDDDLEKSGLPEELPILPIKNTVLFPGVVIPITVGRQKSVKLVRKAYKGDRIIGVIAQKKDSAEEPMPEDIYKIGTVAKIIKMLVLPDGNTTIIIQGKNRFEAEEFVQEDPFMMAKYKLIKEKFPDRNKKETKAVVQSLKDAASKILRLNPEIPQEAQIALDNIESPSFLTHFLSSNISADVEDKQKLLEINDGMKRATLLLEYMLKDVKVLELKHEIQSKVNIDIDQQQRDYYLRQQIKVLQDELGFDGPDQEIERLRAKGEKKKWPVEVKNHFNKELDKVSRLNPAAAEYPVSMN